MRRWGIHVQVLIIPNRNSDRAVAAVHELVERIAARGDSAILEAGDAQACGVPDNAAPEGRLDADLVVALGGDGTILRAARIEGRGVTPILGVNLGRLGFMSGADSDDVFAAVAAALDGGAVIESRSTLSARVTTSSGTTSEHRALNEVYVGRSTPHRVVDIAIDVNGTPLASFYCDGIIIATPTGSTAYALSFGGPIVSPKVEAMLVVPAGAHTLSARPLVLAVDDTVRISFPNPNRAEACVAIDGDMLPCGETLAGVTITRDARPVLLAKVDGSDFIEVVRTKLLGG